MPYIGLGEPPTGKYDCRIPIVTAKTATYTPPSGSTGNYTVKTGAAFVFAVDTYPTGVRFVNEDGYDNGWRTLGASGDEYTEYETIISISDSSGGSNNLLGSSNGVAGRHAITTSTGSASSAFGIGGIANSGASASYCSLSNATGLAGKTPYLSFWGSESTHFMVYKNVRVDFTTATLARNVTVTKNISGGTITTN